MSLLRQRERGLESEPGVNFPGEPPPEVKGNYDKKSPTPTVSDLKERIMYIAALFESSPSSAREGEVLRLHSQAHINEVDNALRGLEVGLNFYIFVPFTFN